MAVPYDPTDPFTSPNSSGSTSWPPSRHRRAAAPRLRLQILQNLRKMDLMSRRR